MIIIYYTQAANIGTIKSSELKKLTLNTKLTLKHTQ